MFLTEQESLFNVLRDKRTTTIALKTNHACKGSMSIYYGSLAWFFNSLTFGDICVFGFKRTISFIFFHVISVVKTTCPRIPKTAFFLSSLYLLLKRSTALSQSIRIWSLHSIQHYIGIVMVMQNGISGITQMYTYIK